MRAQKSQSSIATNTVPATVLPHTAGQEPIFLASRKTAVSFFKVLEYSLEFGRVGVISDFFSDHAFLP